jgi:hypothetical protein
MGSKDHSPSRQVQSLGKAGFGWLVPGQRGQVFAVVSQIVYLLTGEDELVWLAPPGSPKHRRCLQLPGPFPSPAVGTSFTVRDRSLEFETGPKCEFHAAETWEAPRLPDEKLVERKNLPERLFSICDAFLSRATGLGFGALLPPILLVAKDRHSSPLVHQEDRLTASAWPIVEGITRACLGRDFPGVLGQAGALVGLGQGLTPSGDDFLGGLLFGRYLLSCHYPELDFLAVDGFSDWIETCRPGTNRISFTLLKDNAFGYAPEPLNRFGNALLGTGPIESAASAASTLTSLGHSTGWDLLTGFLTGMLPAFVD